MHTKNLMKPVSASQEERTAENDDYRYPKSIGMLWKKINYGRK